jgi:hypothetical protein
MLTEDPFHASYQVKQDKRSNAVDQAQKSFLIRKKSRHEQEKAKLMNPESHVSIVESFNGRRLMLHYLSTCDLRSRSVSKGHQQKTASQERVKQVLQNASEKPFIGGDDQRRSRERSRKMSDVSNYLRVQMAQRLLNLDTDKQANRQLENYILQ